MTNQNTPKIQSPELLAPAGSLRHMRFAFAYDADAIYAGIPRYSLRVRNNSFRLEQIQQGIKEAKQAGKAFYIAANIAPHNDKIKTFLRDLDPIASAPKEEQPHALIMSDPGMIMLVRERYPDLPIHLSVQANVVNWASAKFWQTMGISRIILSRELALEEIAQFIEQVPGMEFEVFVHGALCIAYSGRCLLSGYMNHRDANQGACTNACRWQYDAKPAVETAEGNVRSAEIYSPQAPSTEESETPIFLLEEKTKPGETMAAYEDESGSYIMNSKDLRAVQHVASLTEMGISSLKIEGRTKSHYYVARTCQVYRQAIDDAVQGQPFNMALMNDLEKLSNRGYTEGFLRRHPPQVYQQYERGTSMIGKHQFVGEIIAEESSPEQITIDVKNQFALGDQLELMTPHGNLCFRLEQLENNKGEKMSRAPGSGHKVRCAMPNELIQILADTESSTNTSALEHALLIRETP